jgi:hypothetical protein
VRGSNHALGEYLAAVAALLERFGVSLTSRGPDGDLELLEDPDGNLTFELIGTLPDGATAARSTVAVREEFQPIAADLYERRRYEFELIDRGHDYRRAFHLHSREWFERRHLVVVHEHCERPIGTVRCPHYEGSPIRDAFAGILALVTEWVDPPHDCSALRCLE